MANAMGQLTEKIFELTEEVGELQNEIKRNKEIEVINNCSKLSKSDLCKLTDLLWNTLSLKYVTIGNNFQDKEI